ncbi:MAG TPA: PQQ-binding-like beta-propeller repeat protein [Streptosporangiaceae bacterium]|nr:PQQ-binding-like beta-propeller repeat protein [Streptosporangiaceae bacterium]
MSWNTQGPPSGPVPPPRRRRRGWIIAAAAAAVVLVVVVAGLALTGLSGGGRAAAPATPGPAVPAARPGEWQAGNAQNLALGTWSYRGSFVVAADTALTGYDSRSGHQLWQLKAPPSQGQRTAFCGASREISGSTVVVGIGIMTGKSPTAIDCHSVAAVDVADGRIGWVQPVPGLTQLGQYEHDNQATAPLDKSGLIVAIAGPRVLASWLGVVTALSVADGSRQWSQVVGPDRTLDGRATDPFGNEVTDIAASGPDAYLAVAGIDPDVLQVMRIDLATGRPLRTATLPGRVTQVTEPSRATIISTSPLVLVADEVEPTDSDSVVVLGAALNVTRVINAGPQIDGEGATIGQTLNAGGSGGNPSALQRRPLVVAGGLLIGATLAPSSGGGNPLVAIDLRTGKTRWATAVRGHDIFVPVAVTGSAVEVIGVSQGGTGNPQLMQFSVATGKVSSVGPPRVLGAAPMSDELQYYQFVAAGPVVYAVNWAQTQTTPGSAPAVFTLR